MGMFVCVHCIETYNLALSGQPQALRTICGVCIELKEDATEKPCQWVAGLHTFQPVAAQLLNLTTKRLALLALYPSRPVVRLIEDPARLLPSRRITTPLAGRYYVRAVRRRAQPPFSRMGYWECPDCQFTPGGDEGPPLHCCLSCGAPLYTDDPFEAAHIIEIIFSGGAIMPLFHFVV
jgi:hypothetical protein